MLWDAGRLLLLFAAAVLAGFLSGHLVQSLAIATGLALGFYFWQAYRLHRWLAAQNPATNPPSLFGIWAQVVDTIYLSAKRDHKRKEYISSLLRRFNQFTAAMPDANVILGVENEICWMNEAAEGLLRLHPENDLGQRISNLIRHPDFVRFLHRRESAEALELHAPWQDDLRLSIQIVPLGERERLLVARDISHVYRAERMRRDFIANVSHELRTPLTVLSGYLEACEDMVAELPMALRPALVHMQEQALRMQQIIEDLLTLSRLDSESPFIDDHTNVDVPALLRGLGHDAQILSGDQGHEIHLEVDDKVGLRGDGNELRSAFSNLIANAVRYTPPRGIITVRWFALADGEARFEVEDNGVGIPAEAISRLMERFYRVDKHRSRMAGGTGLGLAIVKHVLQRYGSCLQIHSHLGIGSVFACDFPTRRVFHKHENALKTSHDLHNKLDDIH